MSEELIIRHCSPTLAGIKTGSLFSCSCESKQLLFSQIRNLNKKLVPKGLRILPMRVRNQRALIYLCRISSLKRDLNDSLARKLLEEHGYTPEKTDQCIVRLIERLQSSDEFPHEVGLFLGYPPKDVSAFICGNECTCKYIGCWKVYGDEKAAIKTFNKYKQCTHCYCAHWQKGAEIDRLIVAG